MICAMVVPWYFPTQSVFASPGSPVMPYITWVTSLDVAPQMWVEDLSKSIRLMKLFLYGWIGLKLVKNNKSMVYTEVVYIYIYVRIYVFMFLRLYIFDVDLLKIFNVPKATGTK